jgi:polar amino acid transport system permease protein
MLYQMRWEVVSQNFGYLMEGLTMTLLISLATLTISAIGGMVLAMMSFSRYGVVRAINLTIGEIVRNTPILVQLFWSYYVLPMIFNFRITAITACLIGLSLYSSAFVSEIYRAGLKAVPTGQIEAASVLGMSDWQSFYRIKLPQALRIVLPPLAANFVQLIKYSSLASVFGVGEITRRATELSASTFRPLEIFTFIAVVYFFICWPLSIGIRVLERRMTV